MLGMANSFNPACPLGHLGCDYLEYCVEKDPETESDDTVSSFWDLPESTLEFTV